MMKRFFNQAMASVGREAKAFGAFTWEDIIPAGMRNKKLYDALTKI